MNQIITPFKWGFFLLALFGLSSQVFAQQFSKSIGSGSSNLLLGDPSAVHTQLLYDASDLGNPGTNKIDRVYFRRAGSASTTLTNLTIRLTQTPSTSGFGAFASSSFFTGLTTVYFASSETIPAGTAGSWFSFDISTFSYDPSQRLVVDVSYSSSSNNAFSTTNSPIGNIFSGRKKLYTNNSTSPTGTHTSDWEDFGIDFAPLNDECSNPDWLDPGANCSRIVNSTTFASSQSFPASNCDGNAYSGANDVWFSFFSSGLGDTIRVAALDPLFDPVVDVFNSCPPDTRIDCADKTGKGGTEEIRMANLQPGTQYWVRVFGADAFKGAFSICLRNKNNPCVTPPALIKTNVTETTSNGSVLLELLTTPPQYLDWQQSTDQGNTWSYLNQYDPIDTVIARSQISDTIYFRAVVRDGYCDEAFSNVVKIFVNCATNIAFPPKQFPTYISKVKFQEIDNVSTFDPLGGAYQNFKNLTANICRGTTANLTLDLVIPNGRANNRLIWIDFNQNGDFSDQGEKVFAGARTNITSQVIPITIPANASVGKTLMRVLTFDDTESQTGAGPCDGGVYFFGEIEEYTLEIRGLTIADAGTSGFNCGSTRTMNANSIPEGQGTWSVFNSTGTAIFANANDPNTVVTGLSNGLNVLQWTASSAFCPINSDTVEIRVNQPVQANAGIDATVCTTFVSVNGNSGPIGSTYQWTKISGIGNLATLGGTNAFYSGIGVGVSSLKYSVSVPGCPVSNDTVTITRNDDPSFAFAGYSTTVCERFYTLGANTPDVGQGTWTVISGTGTFSDVHDPNATVSGLSPGINTLRWTISNPPCQDNFDELTLQVNTPILANAGTDIVTCTTFVSVAGNEVFQPNSSSWTKISGDGLLVSVGGNTANYINMGIGVSQLEYSVFVPGCPVSSDTITVTRNDFPSPANAGANQNVCSTSAILNAAAPAIGTGRWTRVSGSGTVTNPTLRNSTVTGLGVGNNVFKWKVSNNPCPADSDNVTINYTPLNVPNAGNDVAVCTTSVTLVGSNRATATATWSQIGGTAIISPFNGGQSAVVNGLSPGINEFIYTLSSAACGSVSDTVVVTRLSPQTANAGSNQVICSNSTSLNAAIPSEGSGRWTLVSGSGSITNPTQANSAVTGLGFGNNVFKWKVSNDPCPADSANVTITVNTIVQAIAGPDQTVCTTGVVVAGNFPPTNGTTRWTRLTGTGLVNSPNSRATAITLLGLGTSTYEYKITVPGCGDTKDTLAINRIAPPTTANAGQNQTVCTNSTTMQANSPTDGTGTWTLVSGTGSIAEPNNPATVINGLSVGDNVFQWTISNEPCTSSSQNVTITYQLPEVADVGPDISVCSSGVVLNANVAGINGGNWNLISGAGTISTFNNGMQAVINGLNPGPNVFEYETSTQCGLLKDTIIVTRFVEPVANAGANQNVCSTSATLNAAAPAIGTGRWTRVSGSGTVTNPTLRNSTVTGLGVGNNVFKWKVSNNPCPADSDNVTINYTPLNVPNAGNDVAVCTTSVTLVGSNRGTATATWSQIGGTAIISPFNGGQSAVVNGLSPGINEFIYTLSSAACGSVSDTVVVNQVLPQIANAGQDQVICSNSTNLAASSSAGIGTWTVVSGSGIFSNPNSPTSSITGLGLGINILKWKVENSPCPADSANVSITVNSIVTANAGIDQTNCSNSATLTGNNPPIGATVQWTRLTGAGTVNSPNSTTTTVSAVGIGSNSFEYRILVPGCPDQTDTVTVIRTPNTSEPNAGPNQTICSTTTNLAGNSPAFGVGTWTLRSGSGTIVNSQNPTSEINGLAVGANVFRWTISNPPCNDRFDEVTINVTSPIVADAGSDQTITANSTTLSAANPSGNWSLLSGSGNLADPSNPTTSVTGMGIGVNEFIWTVSNLPCPDSKDTVRITVNPISSPCLDASVTASFLGGASADIQVNYPFNSIISSYSINYGDGSGFTAHTTPGTVGHSFPAPGIYNVCSRFYFLNVIQELDSCEVCDTVLIQPDTPPCGMAQFSATHLGDLDGEALLTTDDYSPFFRYKIDFGDGTLSQDQGNFAQITHTYSGPGTYSVCARLFYTNSFQVLDSCEYCQLLTIPVPFSPCDSFSVQKVSASRSSIFEPISMRGFLYEINDRVHFKQGSLNSVSVKVYDLPADTVQLEGSLTPGSEGNSLDFNLTLYPGQKRICYIGRFTNSQQEADSCVICRDTLLAAPDPCEFFEVRTEKLCGNQIGVKVLYSNQSPLEGFTLNFGDDQSYLGVNNGDSINHFYANPGEYIVCGQAEVFGGGNQCELCDTIRIYANPNAGPDLELCSDSYFQSGNVVPPVATSAWTVLSGGAILANPTSNDLSASGLSIGVNSFQYGFSVTGCPDLFDTLLITRFAPPTVADAGFDKIVCGNQTNLNAISPTTGNGLWTLISGSGIIAEPSNPSTVVSNLGTSDNQFVWTTSNGICPSSSDTVTITVEPLPTPASAGPDQTVCSDQGQLSGNIPQVGEGVWSVISGGASLVNSGQNNTAVSNLAFGENAFVWSVSVGLCPASTDTIVITRLEPPTAANAGPDQSLCTDQTTLAANSPTVGSGVWTVLSGTATISDPTLSNSGVTGLGQGQNTLVWTISNGICESTTDTVEITVNPPSPAANAGTDQTVCGPNATLAGNASNATGQWTVIQGTGILADPSLANSAVTGLSVGVNEFVWSLNNGLCPATIDTVSITSIELPTVADAGPDQTLCTDQSTLAGNTPGVGSGVWTVLSGTATISDPTLSTSGVSGLGQGQNTLVWTISNGICESTTDTVEITVNPPSPAANAGTDQTVCGPNANLAGNASNATGQWTVIQGTGIVADPSLANSAVASLSVGVNEFVWSLNNGLCPATTDTVSITSIEIPTTANAGPDQTLCTDQSTLAGNTPGVGSGVWTILSGTATISDPTLSTSGVSGLGQGQNTLVWTISNGICESTTDTVEITVNPPSPAANAGTDQIVCGPNANLAGNASNATGQWTVIQGTGIVADPSLANSAVASLSVGVNEFVWSLNNGLCPATTDTVSITSIEIPTTANAGPDQILCGNVTTISANAPVVGTGTWSFVSGSGTLFNTNLPVAEVSNLGVGLNQLAWTITTSLCGSSSDTVDILVNPFPTEAQAGPDQTLCSTQTSLNGNVPQSGTGSWTVLSGTAVVTDPALATSAVTNMSAGINEFVWTIAIGNCPPSADTVRVVVSQPFAVVDAGPDFAVCGSISNLNALIPTTGTWSVLTGSALIQTPTSPNSPVSNLQQGQNGFVWTVQSGVCLAQTDTVFITSNLSFAASAGQSLIACTDTATLQAPTISAPASGLWTVDQGSGIFADPANPQTKVSGLGNGLNVFRWTVSVPTCPDLSDTMVVLRIENNLSIHTDTAVCFIGGDSLVLSVPLQFTSFTWSNGATNRTIVLYAADTLIVTATTAQNCTFTDTIRVREAICDAIRPTMSNQPFQVQLQPNPAVDQAWMQVKTAEPGFARLSVINALGQEIGHNEQLWIGSQMEHRLDTSNLPSGIYTIRLSDGKRHWTGKLVIRK